MTIGIPEIFKKFPHLQRMFEIELEFNECKWYQFWRKYNLTQELRALEIFGFQLGIKTALEDLEKFGLIKINKNNLNS